MIRAIIEIKKDHHGESIKRLLRSLSEMEVKFGIKDHHLCDQDATDIPDFGHDYKCRCENPEPYGVARYFNLFLEWPDCDKDLGDTLKINEFSQVILCGKRL